MIVKHKRIWGAGVAGVGVLAVTVLTVTGDIDIGGGVGGQCVDRPVVITAIAIAPGHVGPPPAADRETGRFRGASTS